MSSVGTMPGTRPTFRESLLLSCFTGLTVIVGGTVLRSPTCATVYLWFTATKAKKQQKRGATDRIPFFVAELYGISIRFAIVTHELGLSITIYKYSTCIFRSIPYNFI